jgi:uncharacterized membrane protein
MSRLVQCLTLATALGCGLSAGVFFALSAFVMPALDRLAPGQSIRAMNSINKLAVTPVFMTANVPLNDALMNVDPEGADAAARWSGYLSDWTLWNHARAATAIGASGLLISALWVSP